MAYYGSADNAYTALAAPALTGATELTVTDATQLPALTVAHPSYRVQLWAPGTYAEPGDDPEAELRTVTNVVGNVLTVAALTYDHAAGERVANAFDAASKVELEDAIDGKTPIAHATSALTASGHGASGPCMIGRATAGAGALAEIGTTGTGDAVLKNSPTIVALLAYATALAEVLKSEYLRTGVTNSLGTCLKVVALTDAAMADGFGPAVTLYAEDDGGTENALVSVGGIRYGADNTGRLSIRTAITGVLGTRVQVTQNLLLGTITDAGAGTAALLFGDGTVPSSLASNTAGLYANDVAGTVEMFAIDEAGNSTQISPHDPETGELYLASQNEYTGRRVRIDLERLALAVEKLTGEKFLHEDWLPEEQLSRWEDKPTRAVDGDDDEEDAEGKPPPAPKPRPKWMAEHIKRRKKAGKSWAKDR